MSMPPEKQPPPENKLRGVEARGFDDGHEVVVLNPSQISEQWPSVSVTSVDFDKLEPWVGYYEQAIAFLNAAKVLSEVAGTTAAAGGGLTWPQGSVCYYCLNIATELFLKACIWAHSGKRPKMSHGLAGLYEEYSKTLPKPEFLFQLPLAWLAPSSMFDNSVDRTPDQLYRYHIGTDGKASELTHVFRPDTVINRVNDLDRIWQRAWRAISHSDKSST
jgi:hypothetical protein